MEKTLLIAINNMYVNHAVKYFLFVLVFRHRLKVCIFKAIILKTDCKNMHDFSDKELSFSKSKTVYITQRSASKRV